LTFDLQYSSAIFEVIVARQMALRYEPVHRLRQFQSSMAVWLT
jgi:hypothetical protein